MKCMICGTDLKNSGKDYYYCHSKICSIRPYSKYVVLIDPQTQEVKASHIVIKLQNNKKYALSFNHDNNVTYLSEVYKNKETDWYGKNEIYTINSVIAWNNKGHAKKIVEKLLKLKGFS